MRSSILACRLKPALYAIMVPFLLFELWVHAVISRHLRLAMTPVVRRRRAKLRCRRLLALHRQWIGRAFGFVVPLTYFIFIILSTLRLDFWLSSFTGLVAAMTVCMAMFHVIARQPSRRRICTITASAAWSY
jgi:adenylate cyclase